MQSSTSGIVTCFLTTPLLGFSTSVFNVGDEIFVENVKTLGDGDGYNSSDYLYEPFVITGVNTNPGGGNATVSYKLDTLVTNPGIFSGPSSSGRVIPFEDVATFKDRSNIFQKIILKN